MARTDLLALTDDGLIQLANAGLVKRALRELAAGSVPDLEESDDGTITVRFADGTETRLPTGKSPRDASCSCPSSSFCRHRVMLVLAYRQRFAGQAGATASEDSAWDPASLDVEAFESALGPSAKAELKRLLGSSIAATLERGQTPAARLPMATVRFLVPGDISYARCDCVQEQGCVHVALALRAFRAACGGDSATIGETSAGASESGTAALQLALDQVIAQLLEVGVTAGPAAHAQPLNAARKQAEALGATQALLAIEALSEQIDAYEHRSARYEEAAVLALAAELHARPRAADISAALGLGDPFETPMTKSRLVSLGARLFREGAFARACVLLADSDTGATMLLEKVFAPPPASTSQNAPPLLQRLIAPGLSVAGLARGQILTSVARRRADGLLTLGRGSGGKTQLVPRDALCAFPAPLSASAIQPLTERLATRPLSLVRPRRCIDDVHVFEVEEVMGQSWSPATQSWEAAVRLRNEDTLLYLERSFDAAAQDAVSVLTAAFAGELGRLRQVTGPVRLDGGALLCEPWSLAADRFVVPDIDANEDASAPIPPGAETSNDSSLDQAQRLMSGMLHAGARARDSAALKAALEVVAALRADGYATTADRVSAWLSDPAHSPLLFARAAVWLVSLRESA
ncbi:MAG: SWIM zinc finger family protein [Alphaproteobacteria bacterium]|nr:SWIM zinc finger family protein [Alphaproteobacteria bacterium]